MLDQYSEVLTINEAAEILGVSNLTLKRWEKKGRIQPLRINSRGDRRYLKEQIVTLLGEETEVVTIEEAAQMLRVSKITLKRWEKKGLIQPLRINTRGDRRYPKEQIMALLGE